MSKVIKLDKRTKEQRLLDTMKLHRKISREIEIERGVHPVSHIFKNKKKYDRKAEKRKPLEW